MQEFDKTQLIEQLLALFNARQQFSASEGSQADLRVQIGRTIDKAMVNTQGRDSRRVTILLSDLRVYLSDRKIHHPGNGGSAEPLLRTHE